MEGRRRCDVLPGLDGSLADSLADPVQSGRLVSLKEIDSMTPTPDEIRKEADDALSAARSRFKNAFYDVLQKGYLRDLSYRRAAAMEAKKEDE